MKQLTAWSICLGVLLWASLSHADDNKIVVANGEWFPYISQELKHYGVFSHIITEAFALEGVTVEFKWVPWKRALEKTYAGVYDATSSWIWTEERAKYLEFSDIIMESKKVFFHLKETSFDWETIEDLKGLRIGGVIGYTYGTEFDKAAESGRINVEFVAKDIQNFDKLLKDRIDIYPQELEIGYSYINRYGADTAARFTHHPKVIILTRNPLNFSKKVPKNKQLLEKFNRGLKQLKDSGRWQAMIEAANRGEYQK